MGQARYKRVIFRLVLLLHQACLRPGFRPWILQSTWLNRARLVGVKQPIGNFIPQRQSKVPASKNRAVPMGEWWGITQGAAGVKWEIINSNE